jgi:hypothetical protein
MTYNWPRAEVHVFLERALELVPALERSAAELPREYDPPYRLAWVLFKAGELAEAQAAIEKAAHLAYGPRKVRVQQLAVDIAKAGGNVALERAARTALVGTLERLEKGHEQPEALAKAKADLEAMNAAQAVGPDMKQETGPFGGGGAGGGGGGQGTGPGNGMGRPPRGTR